MDLVSRASLLFGSSPALVSSEATLSFRTCAAITSQIAGRLHDKGLRTGDTVAMITPNTPEALLLMLALQRTGLVCAPLNHRFPPVQLLGTLEALQPQMVVVGDPSLLPKACTTGTELLHDLTTAVSGPEIPLPSMSPVPMERPVSVIHTSASSGKPKAALHSFANHWYSALGAARKMPLQEGDCWLLSLPLFHIGGYAILFRALVSGSAVAVPKPGEPLERSLERFPATHLSLVPTQLHRLLGNPEALNLLEKLKVVLLGGSAVSSSLLEESIRQDVPVYLSYGSTEMCSQIATTPERVTSVQGDSGEILPWRELRIGDDGEILVRGACLFQGYLRNSQPVLPLDSDGWFHTGDTGSMSQSGRLSVIGRKDNMFISGGENLHPEEIEQALSSVEGIEQALVVPVRDNEYGWRPVAFIETAEPDSPGDEAISSALRKSVGKLKTPVRYTRVMKWTTLPGSQKIDRKWYQRLALISPLQPDA